MHESQIGHIHLDAAPFTQGCGSTEQIYTLIAAVIRHELDLGVRRDDWRTSRQVDAILLQLEMIPFFSFF